MPLKFGECTLDIICRECFYKLFENMRQIMLFRNTFALLLRLFDCRFES